jgi:NAD(P)-dependent dehydrogenase (short-subunit alcohol dehydrogenase family)
MRPSRLAATRIPVTLSGKREETSMAWETRFSLRGQRALVTGASKGIGLEICKVLSDAGADIAAVGRDQAGLAEAKAAVEANGRLCAVISADMESVEETRSAARRAMEALGGVDILVNNAGIALIDPLLDAKVEDWDRTMAVNLRAPFVLAQAVVPGMIERKRGKIINISSQAGVIALNGHGAYAASKGGLNMLTKVMMAEWAPHNIQVNAVCPTIILTPMGEKVWGDPAKGKPMLDRTPLGRFGKTIEVADLVLFLSSSASDLINGECVLIDAGFSSM